MRRMRDWLRLRPSPAARKVRAAASLPRAPRATGRARRIPPRRARTESCEPRRRPQRRIARGAPFSTASASPRAAASAAYDNPPTAARGASSARGGHCSRLCPIRRCRCPSPSRWSRGRSCCPLPLCAPSRCRGAPPPANAQRESPACAAATRGAWALSPLSALPAWPELCACSAKKHASPRARARVENLPLRALVAVVGVFGQAKQPLIDAHDRALQHEIRVRRAGALGPLLRAAARARALATQRGGCPAAHVVVVHAELHPTLPGAGLRARTVKRDAPPRTPRPVLPLSCSCPCARCTRRGTTAWSRPPRWRTCNRNTRNQRQQKQKWRAPAER